MQRSKTGVVKRGTSINCPHCGQPSLVRKSSQISPLVRESSHICTNDECCHVFIAQLAIIRTIAPSINPKPDIIIPFGNPNLRWNRRKSDDDPPPVPANDDQGGHVSPHRQA
ncbi:hypothetical protein FHS51_001714 [Sphingobium wenxiniae]|uniref:Ogr/Delta-like zinc finger protein n=1 Tax=Sphingobium wenxiniae (strain DSM 21828 / CGMCC 1.7748 / JZ-1) TaxID=595605 RepID=A0A562KCW7_SPHWJ|nr:ogr/Delta-like zinc finger family protein [Sphingobium wenxiniae]MBB6191487.1 hypothetical protein [Sphingobium wenxiniae]TWH93222.1 Ogr/Delta-like zinc finger protein [Sphingobium wenxiniae]